MAWLHNLLFENGIAHSILVLSFVIALGIALGKVKIFRISLGMTFVLFVGIAVSHFGFIIDHTLLHFLKEFGLILFVYAVGLQVGPGFFASFKKGGIQLNMLACGIVFIGVAVTLIIHFVSGLPMSTMVGILSGAVTNTPGLGAAQQAYTDIYGQTDPSIALGYAVAYPLGVIGIIFSILLIRIIFKINLKKESETLKQNTNDTEKAFPISVLVKNKALFGKQISEISRLIDRKFVISRICRPDGKIEVATSDTVLNENDKILIVTIPQESDAILAFVGDKVEMSVNDWNQSNSTNRRILITRKEINGKTIEALNLRATHGVNITRVNRSGVDLIAQAGLKLQIGDRLIVVGEEHALDAVEKLLGNRVKDLNEPNLIGIFIGIFLGVFLGSIPIAFPGIPQPVKLGLAGGPLIVAILLSVFGSKLKVVTFTTASANLMLREIGICLFLACVGLGAGENFVQTIVYGGGLRWIALGVIITMTPLLIIGILGYKVYKINYFVLMGLMAGSTTDPPALAYANTTTDTDAPAISYATVYPLTMFLRVLTAQLLILLFA